MPDAEIFIDRIARPVRLQRHGVLPRSRNAACRREERGHAVSSPERCTAGPVGCPLGRPDKARRRRSSRTRRQLLAEGAWHRRKGPCLRRRCGTARSRARCPRRGRQGHLALREGFMADKKTITIAIMDAPYESGRSTTTLRLIDLAAKRGYNINVFAYEGAVLQPFAAQKPHPNAVHGRDVEQENHFIPKDAIAALMREAEKNGGKIDWVNCGLCVDERGAVAAIPGVRRGSPADFWTLSEASDNTLVIATR